MKENELINNYIVPLIDKIIEFTQQLIQQKGPLSEKDAQAFKELLEIKNKYEN